MSGAIGSSFATKFLVLTIAGTNARDLLPLLEEEIATLTD